MKLFCERVLINSKQMTETLTFCQVTDKLSHVESCAYWLRAQAL